MSTSFYDHILVVFICALVAVSGVSERVYGRQNCLTNVSCHQVSNDVNEATQVTKYDNAVGYGDGDNVALSFQKDICDRYDVDGCSIPFGLPFFYKGLFTHSCNRHDVCYHCGVAYNLTRYECDKGFRRDTKAACVDKYKSGSNLFNQEKSRPQHKRLLIASLTRQHRELRAVFQRYISNSSILFGGRDITPEQFQRIVKSSQEKVLVLWARMLFKDLQTREIQAAQRRRKVYSRPDSTHGSGWIRRRLKYSAQRLQFALEYKEKQRRDDMTAHAPSSWGYELGPLCQRVLRNLEILGERSASSVTDTNLDCADIQLLVCYFFSEVYYLAVRLFAFTSFHTKPEFFCGESFVPKCLPPTP